MTVRPPRRRVVAGFTALALAGLLGLVALSYGLRQDHPATGPLTPEVAGGFDSLREEVVCELEEGREGEDRQEATSEPSVATEITSNELYDCPQTWDGRLIRYTGEAIGALLDQSEGVWVQLNDDIYGQQAAPLPTHRDFRGGNAGVGVLLPPDLAVEIDAVGGPKQHGDVVEVIGRFVRVDGPTGEVAIIRAEQLRMVTEGSPLDIPGTPGRSVVAVVALFGAVGISLVERRIRTR